MDNLNQDVVLEEKDNKNDISEEILSIESDEVLDQEEQKSIDKLIEDYSHFSRQELLNEITTLSNSENIEQMKMRSNLVRNAFRDLTQKEIEQKKKDFVEAGNNEEDFVEEDDNLTIEFNKQYAIYKEKRQKYLDEQEQIKMENVQKKNSILEELKQLLDSDESLKDIYDKFNKIQERWKEIGQVPRAEINNLWQNYHFLIEKFYDKVKINRELRELDLKKNLDAKIALCEKVEELLLEPSINKSFKALQEIHQKWKEIGGVPQDKNEEIWERFKKASDTINNRRQQYYESIKADLETNLLAKKALCDKAEEILKKERNTIKQWTNDGGDLSELLKLWKTIGPVPQKDNEEIWKRFKGSLNEFFALRKDVLKEFKAQQEMNFTKKNELCLKAEALSQSTQWKKTTEEFKKLRQQWKEVGGVSKKLSEELWNRFQNACNTFFENKAKAYLDRKEEEGKNIAKKQEIINQVRDFSFGDNKEENLNTIKDFQRQWSEVGYINQVERERLQKEFRKIIDEHFEKLRIDKIDNKIDNIIQNTSSSQGGKPSNKIKTTLTNKKNELVAQLRTLENNVGFFSHSKQSNLLKEEFEKKIENIKKEIALYDVKIKAIGKEIANKDVNKQDDNKEKETSNNAKEELEDKKEE
ncbi:MAG: DUF349 domain-containing protein [Bacteroidales bacterium]|jgi:hypothetical protein|nr:DUF349 domain-containing protein [Bacteroidales bacterium]